MNKKNVIIGGVCIISLIIIAAIFVIFNVPVKEIKIATSIGCVIAVLAIIVIVAKAILNKKDNE